MKNDAGYFAVGEGCTALHYKIIRLGNDVQITVWGAKAHIGSIAVGIGRPSLQNAAENSATVSVINMTGHKDDALTQNLAYEVSKACNCVCVVVGGFHLDDITKDQLSSVIENQKEAAKKIIDCLITDG